MASPHSLFYTYQPHLFKTRVTSRVPSSLFWLFSPFSQPPVSFSTGTHPSSSFFLLFSCFSCCHRQDSDVLYFAVPLCLISSPQSSSKAVHVFGENLSLYAPLEQQLIFNIWEGYPEKAARGSPKTYCTLHFDL